MATATAAPSNLTLSSASTLVLFDARATLGESPVHDARTGAVYAVDIEGRAVLVLPAGFDGAGGDEGKQQPFAIPTPLPVGGVTPTSDRDTLLISQPDGVHLLDLKTRTLGPPLASIPAAHATDGTRFNDGLASPQGTWIGGRLHKDWRQGKRGRVYALVWEEGEGAAPALEPVLEEAEVGMSNGMAWSENGSLFFLADSAEKCVLRFDADPATGIPISGTGRVCVSSETLGGSVPDGLCLDSEGRVWVALAETGTVGVFSPDAATGGAEVGRLSGLPLTRLTSVAWGRGEEAGSLLITSRAEAGEGASPVAGAVLCVRGTGARGREEATGGVSGGARMGGRGDERDGG